MPGRLPPAGGVHARRAGVCPARRASSPNPSPAARIAGEYEGRNAALRLFGAVHYLVLTGLAPDALSGDWGDFTDALEAHADTVGPRMREQGVQTNEVQRCVALLPHS